MQAMPAMSTVCFWEDSMVSASSIQISHKGERMEQGEWKQYCHYQPFKKG